MTGTATLGQQLLAAVNDLRTAQAELEAKARDYARTEAAYRHAKAVSYLQSEGKNQAEREANAELVVFGEGTLNLVRYRRDLDDALRNSAQEAVRTHRGIVSALQSLAALERAEADLARYGSQQAVGA